MPDLCGSPTRTWVEKSFTDRVILITFLFFGIKPEAFKGQGLLLLKQVDVTHMCPFVGRTGV